MCIRDSGWSLVEAYRNEDGAFVRGYIRTKTLRTVEPNTLYGLSLIHISSRARTKAATNGAFATPVACRSPRPTCSSRTARSLASGCSARRLPSLSLIHI